MRTSDHPTSGNISKRRAAVAAVMALMLSTTGPLDASWLSDITGINIDVPKGRVEIGRPNPAAIPRMLENLPKDVGQALLSPHGQALASTIRHAIERARGSAQPIPGDIQRQLAPYFPPEVLRDARWTSYDRGHFALDTAVIGFNQWLQQEGAITLDHIIVFANPANANPLYFNDRNPEVRRLWAHELTHVMQYRNMGIEGFATFYSVNWPALEGQAKAWSNRIEGLLEGGDAGEAPRYAHAATGPVYGSEALTAQHFAAAARRYFPASSCASIQPSHEDAYTVRNVCPVAIVVTGWDLQHPQQGPGYAPCTFDCVIPPNGAKRIGSIFGAVRNVSYGYLR
jgi:hypothetical protein